MRSGPSSTLSRTCSAAGSRKTKRRSAVVQVFPNTAGIRLATAVFVELHDEWIDFPRRHPSLKSMGSLYADNTTCLPGTVE